LVREKMLVGQKKARDAMCGSFCFFSLPND